MSTEKSKRSAQVKGKSDQAGRRARSTRRAVQKPKLRKGPSIEELEAFAHAPRLKNRPISKISIDDRVLKVGDYVAIQELNPSTITSGWADGGTETPHAVHVRISYISPALLEAYERYKVDLLNRYRVDADEPIAVTLAFMSLEDRNRFLDLHYPKRTEWAKVRSKRPTPSELLGWVEDNFPDRFDLMLVQRDLKHLDPDAYAKVTNWTRPKQDGSTVKLPKKFGFPLKDGTFSSTLAKYTPTAKEIQESAKRDSPNLGKLIRRYQRGQYHIAKP